MNARLEGVIARRMDRRVLGNPTAAEVEAISDTAVSLYALRAQARAGQADWAGAEADYTRALKGKAPSPGFYRERGLARLHRGRVAQAQQDFEVYLQAHPEGRAALDAEIQKIRGQEK